MFMAEFRLHKYNWSIQIFSKEGHLAIWNNDKFSKINYIPNIIRKEMGYTINIQKNILLNIDF